MGHLPAELFGNLVAHRLLALDAEGFFEGGDVEPAFLRLSLADEARAVADEAVDQRDVRTVELALDTVRDGHIFRHEDMGFDSGGGGICGEGSGGIAGRRDGEILQAVMARHRDGGRETASLEGAGGIQALVLSDDVGILAAGQHGGEAFTQRDRFDVGENLLIAPHVGGAFTQLGRTHRCLGGSHVVAHVQHAAIFRANG